MSYVIFLCTVENNVEQDGAHTAKRDAYHQIKHVIKGNAKFPALEQFWYITTPASTKPTRYARPYQFRIDSDPQSYQGLMNDKKHQATQYVLLTKNYLKECEVELYHAGPDNGYQDLHSHKGALQQENSCAQRKADQSCQDAK